MKHRDPTKPLFGSQFFSAQSHLLDQYQYGRLRRMVEERPSRVINAKKPVKRVRELAWGMA